MIHASIQYWIVIRPRSRSYGFGAPSEGVGPLAYKRWLDLFGGEALHDLSRLECR
jgi:hypothetical protein